MIIREAHAGDAAAIAALHAASWRATYGPLLGPAFAQRDIEGERDSYWRDTLVKPFDGFALVAEENGKPVGFIAVFHHGEDGYDAVIDNLHVQPGLAGHGLGRRMIAAAARRLLGQGRSSIALRVLDRNERAFAFYARLGGTADDKGVDLYFGGDACDTRFGWHDLEDLIRTCEEQRP